MVSPQDQRVNPHIPATVKVAPEAQLPCEVEGASDSDHWTIGAQQGDEADDLTYSWLATGGARILGNGASASFIAPSKTGSYTITCTVDDGNNRYNDESVIVEVTVVVPPRTWSAGAGIGSVLNDQGKPVVKDGVPVSTVA